jgi:hypothetical protein
MIPSYSLFFHYRRTWITGQEASTIKPRSDSIAFGTNGNEKDAEHERQHLQTGSRSSIKHSS